MNGPVVRVVRIAEDLRELGPVRDPHRRVDRTAGREPHERSDRGTDALDGLVRGGDLLDVDAWRQSTWAYQLLTSVSCDSLRCQLHTETLRRVDGHPARRVGARIEHLHRTLAAVAEDHLGLRGDRLHAPAQLARPFGVEVQDHDVRPRLAGCADDASLGCRSWPITSAPSSARRRAMPMTMIGAEISQAARVAPHRLSTLRRSPITCTAERGLGATVRADPHARLVIPASRGTASCPAPSSRSTPPPGTVAVPLASSPAAVRAITRVLAGPHAVEDELALRGWCDAKRPRSGSTTHALATGSPSLSRTTPPKRWSSSTVRAGRVLEAEAHRLRAHVRPAGEASGRTRPRA